MPLVPIIKIPENSENFSIYVNQKTRELIFIVFEAENTMKVTLSTDIAGYIKILKL
jgi:hypothetical protein